jgi:hypothetical protein
MAYSDFTLRKVKDVLGLTLVEGGRFLPTIAPVAPSPYLADFLQESLPLAIATGSEKARSELIISPLLVEVRRQLDREVSVFSGEEFTVDAELGLNGVCDFLISRSAEQMLIEAPTIVIVEAKKGDLKPGLGQCIAEMAAAQRFNAAKNLPISTIYGCVSSGTLWRLLKLEGNTITADLTEYLLPPVDPILGTLIWMVKQG